LDPSRIGDVGGIGLSGGFGEHFGLGVHADSFGDVLSEREGELAGAAAQVEEASGAVQVESLDEVVKEHLGIAWSIARVVPGRSCEQSAAGSAE
jgi:hypothetical protein